MKSFNFILISISFIALFVILAIVSGLLFEYSKTNEAIKKENWKLIENNRRLGQRLDVCAKELKEYKNN